MDDKQCVNLTHRPRTQTLHLKKVVLEPAPHPKAQSHVISVSEDVEAEGNDSSSFTLHGFGVGPSAQATSAPYLLSSGLDTKATAKQSRRHQEAPRIGHSAFAGNQLDQWIHANRGSVIMW